MREKYSKTSCQWSQGVVTTTIETVVSREPDKPVKSEHRARDKVLRYVY